MKPLVVVNPESKLADLTIFRSTWFKFLHAI